MNKTVLSPQSTKIADINATLADPVDLGGVGAFNRIQDIAIRKHPRMRHTKQRTAFM